MRHKGMMGAWCAEKMGGEDIHKFGGAGGRRRKSKRLAEIQTPVKSTGANGGLRYTTYLCPKGSSW